MGNHKRARLSSASHADNSSAELRHDDLDDISHFSETDGGNILLNETRDISAQCASQASCSQGDSETAMLRGKKQASTESNTESDSTQRIIPYQSVPSTQPAAISATNTLHTPGPQLTQPGAVMRVKVRIKDKLFLVPIPPEGSQSKTIGWLCDEAADRYYKSCHLQVNLNLYTQDGALLSPADLVVMVLTHNEEVRMLRRLRKLRK